MDEMRVERRHVAGPLVLPVVMTLALALACAVPSADQQDEQAGKSGSERSSSERESSWFRFAGGAEKRELPAGTPITVALVTTVDSGSASVGQDVRGEVVSDVSVGGAVVVPAGTAVRGSVTQVQPAKHFGGQASVAVRFDSIDAASRIPVEGSVSASAKKQTGKDTATIAGSAVGGAILGKVLGEDDQDAAVGAVVGGGIGTAVASRKGAEAVLGSGTHVVVHVEKSVTLRAAND